MFWKRVNYALILMIELAQAGRGKGVELSVIAEKYNLSLSAFDGILEQLESAGYITHRDGSLSMRIEPDKISIWNIVECVDKIKEVELTELTELTQGEQPTRTSTAIMVEKEIEVVLKVIQYRLQRHKLSAWSEKASKVIYI